MTEMIRPVLVKALPGYRVYLEFSDGTKGEVDLSDLADKGVFEVWKDYNFFERVHIGDHREIKWNDEIELCADSLVSRGVSLRTPPRTTSCLNFAGSTASSSEC